MSLTKEMIRESSELTITLLKHPEEIAVSTAICTSGFPWNFKRFLPGKRFEFPRAGITQIVIRIGYVLSPKKSQSAS
jgi:hypothetical protein